ncbi:RNA polymerase sigma factor [Pelotomaculum propionicicum]|uniref:ECF RNA polymerase sigma factor SigW n=1 Tax=Pelotomaculum propionicicum TaxID=258475 RepID=A0A4Y7RJ97_9FIRM|nr:RNA polymerase sigma factor [Pelotomaculum propionicicum]NLI14358.1 RNA polymerase sigma factor [Peptococcaceae bacterium]TEB08881.1 ECF RNA polymerase sigma factor SigW [Pelotomaculum propionicicum]
MKGEIIVKKLNSGDSRAFRLVYELFYKQVYQAAFFITNDAGLAEDVVHEAFLKLMDKIVQIKDPSKLEAWLCRTAANKARDIIRHRSVTTLFAEARDIYSDNQLISPETVLLEKEKKQIIQQHIRILQPEHKRVFYLKYYKDMSVNEISTETGIPAGTVKSRLARAREELKRIMDPEERLNRHSTVELQNRKR